MAIPQDLRCPTCNQVKTPADFYPKTLPFQCKACVREYNRKYYARNREKINARSFEWHQKNRNPGNNPRRSRSAYDGQRVRISHATYGAAIELIVCSDLLCRGYEVFRSVSPNCSCDALVQKDGRIQRVEIKAGLYDAEDSIITSQAKPPDPSRFDILAIVAENEILYCPGID